jgi:hypothetical protein
MLDTCSDYSGMTQTVMLLKNKNKIKKWQGQTSNKTVVRFLHWMAMNGT